jgi:outer membrane protein TolC
MKHMKLLSLSSGIAATVLAFSGPVWALQPLQEFLAGARHQSFAAQEQNVNVRVKEAEEEVAFGRLLPSLTAKGTYSYNQYEAKVTVPGSGTSIVITPHNQLDAIFLLEAPLVDLASRARHDQSELMIEATRLQGELVGLDLDRAVSRLYSQYTAAAAARSAAEQSLGLAQKNFDVVKTRVELGAGTELDLARASANLERSKQDKTEFELVQSLYARQLNTLSGLEPTPVTAFPEDALQPEAPLSQWLGVQNTPADRLSVKLTEAIDASKRAANYALLPTLSATAQERITNATGFAGKAASYTLQGVLTWRLDYSTMKQRDLVDANLALQQVRTAKTRRDLEDQIFTAHQQIQSGIAKSTAARAQVAATKKAADLSLERYQAGAATQLDVTQAQRDAFSANVSQIQADADLAYARLLLRINAGQAMGAEPPPKTAP